METPRPSPTVAQSRISQSVSEITDKNIRDLVRHEEQATPPRTWSQGVARWVTRACGSTWFLWTHLTLFAAWISLNTALPRSYRWDPFPFPALGLWVPMEALFLSMFILITQRREMVLAERRAHLDLQINLLAEHENTEMLKLLSQIALKLGLPGADHPDVKALQEKTEPKEVLEQIDKSLAGSRDVGEKAG